MFYPKTKEYAFLLAPLVTVSTKLTIAEVVIIPGFKLCYRMVEIKPALYWQRKQTCSSMESN